MRKLVQILLFGLLLVSCKELVDPEPPEFAEKCISLTVEGRKVFVYDELICQYSFDSQGSVFRAFTDDMGDYLFISLKYSQPLKKGDSLTAGIQWAVGRSAPQEKSNVSFTVEDIDEEGYVYLWSSGSRIAAVIHTF